MKHRLFLALLFPLFFCSAAAAQTYDPGLVYENGVEPGDPSTCEAPSGKKCIYVDADAANGGNGSYASPYNSFETAVGYMDGSNYVPGQLAGGDVLYVRGTFRASQHNESSNNLTIHLGRGSQAGTPSQPTIIKSYPGSQRAVFDGEYALNDFIHVRALSGSPSNGVRIENIEIMRANGRGIYIAENVKHAEIVSVAIHDGKGDGIMGVGGAILLSMTSLQHDFTVRNSLFYSNNKLKTGSDNNVGAIGILSEGSALSGSKVRIFNNVLYDELNAIRHKHSGNIITEAFYNDISNCTNAFFIRAFDNDLHHNLIRNCDVAFQFDAENQQGNQTSEISYNTIYETPVAVHTGYEQTSYQRNINFHDNVFYRSSQGEGIITLGRWSSNTYPISQWNSSKNYFHNAGSSSFLFHQGNGKSFSTAMSYVGDTGSSSESVSFVDVGSNDFRLTPSSPGVGDGTSGTDVGAFPASGSAPPSPPTGLVAN